MATQLPRRFGSALAAPYTGSELFFAFSNGGTASLRVDTITHQAEQDWLLSSKRKFFTILPAGLLKNPWCQRCGRALEGSPDRSLSI
jgi:hypothetical protein